MGLPKRLACVGIAVFGACTTMLAASALAHASAVRSWGGWIPAWEVSSSGDASSIGPVIRVDGNGALHLVWMGGTDPLKLNSITVTHSYNGGESWAGSERLDTGAISYQADMAVDVTGTVHVVWRAKPIKHQLWHGRWANGAWETEMITESVQIMNEPSVEMADGCVHVVWSQYPAGQFVRDLYYSRRCDGSDWSNPQRIAATTESSDNARIALDGDDNVHVVWEENTAPHSVLYVSGTVESSETVWSTPPITLSGDLGVNATTPSIAVGGSNQMVHVVFGADVQGEPDAQEIFYVGFPISDTDHITPTLVPGSKVLISHELPTYATPSLCLSDLNEVHVVWDGMQAGDVYDRIYYAMSEDQGTSWSTPVAISGNDAWPDGFPTIASDGDFIHVAWQQQVNSADQDVFYSRRFPVVAVFPLVFKNYQ
jgi:hypothetical protein